MNTPSLKKYFLGLVSCLLLLFSMPAWAALELEAVYPYSLEAKRLTKVQGTSTLPLYLNVLAYDQPQEQAQVQVTLPEGWSILPEEGWQQQGNIAKTIWTLPQDYGQSFGLLYLQPQEGLEAGSRELTVTVATSSTTLTKRLTFAYEPKAKEQAATKEAKGKKKDKSRYNWYIQSVNLPVDSLGKADTRAAKHTIYLKDVSLETFRNRITGEGATNWAAVFNHPAAYLLLELRNPQRDVRVLRFKAELIDRTTGKVVPGLCTNNNAQEEGEGGWGGAVNDEASTAMISLDGNKAPSYILPLYVDYFKVLEGEYTLRVTVSGSGQEKVHEVPLILAQSNNTGLMTAAFGLGCLLLVLTQLGALGKTIVKIGAKGAITVALVAALAFGGIAVPTTILGELLHVFLGPFSGLVTGLLNGVLQYLLLMTLLVLYPRPGVVALMLLVKYMLSGILLGSFSPLGMISCAVHIVILEAALYLIGFYKHPQRFMVVALAMGLADGLITFVNLQQMMFFYRLYYADWYIGLYMLINGFLYSSIGGWLGARLGQQLQQVTGE